MAVIIAIVLILSLFLCVHAISGHGLIGCSQGTSCNQVLGSRWSFLLGEIPVSALAIGAYLAMFASLLVIDRPGIGIEEQSFLMKVVLFISGAITGCAVWFIYLQHAFIHAFCPYCMSAHILGIILSVLCIIYCIRKKAELKPSDGSSAIQIKSIPLILAGVMMAVILAILQLLTTPRSLSERGFVEEKINLPEPDSMPLVGSCNAPNKVTVLFDWQCSHCRKLHLMLPQVTELLNDSVAFVCCPVAMSQECNPYITPGPDSFQGSCQLLRIGMALWNIDHDMFLKYQEWFYKADSKSGWYPPSVETAKEMAASLAGEQQLEAAIKDESIDTYMSQIAEVFGRTSVNGLSAVPRLIFDDMILIPDADTPSSLASLIRDSGFIP